MVTRNNFFTVFSFIFLIGVCNGQYKADEWAERDSWMNIQDIFKLCGISVGHLVADIGCHEGYLTIHLSNHIGASGKVYAVDVRKDRLDLLSKHIKSMKIENVEVILGDYDNPKLPLNLLDVVILMDTYHEIDEYMVVLEHVRKSLKPNGRIVIIEKFKSHLLNKSRDEQTDAHTLSLDYVKSDLEKAGFSISKEIHDFGYWKNDKDKKIWILLGTLSE